MRLIDADKLNPDRMTNKGTVAISQSQIAKTPTIQAVPIEALDKIRAEIEALEKPYRIHTEDEYEVAWNDAIDQVLTIIDKYRKEQE